MKFFFRALPKNKFLIFTFLLWGLFLIRGQVLGAATISIQNADLLNGTVNTAYPTTTLIAAGGTPPYTWSITSGSLPAGLTLSSSGIISGTPTQVGWSNFFTIQVSDTVGNTGTLKYSITVTPPLDKYGGIIGQTCTNTGYFHMQKIGNRWMFCTPVGNQLWSQSIGAIAPSAAGPTYVNKILAKYGDADITWGPQQLRRMVSWGFNTVGQSVSAYVLPYATNSKWPGDYTQPVKLPMYATAPAGGVMRNDNHYAAGPVKSVSWGLPPGYTRWRGTPAIDFFDPLAFTWLDNWIAADTNVRNPLQSPWTLIALGDDMDWMFGYYESTPEFSTHPDGYGGINFGWMTMTSSPVQTSAIAPRGGNNLLYPTQIVYTKAGIASPQPTDCSVYNPCTLRDFLKWKYGTIGALNAAWTGAQGTPSYTTFDSTGIQVTGEVIGTGDGATKVFTHAFARTSPLGLKVSPESIRFNLNSTPIGGDCPWFNDSCYELNTNQAKAVVPQGAPISPGVMPDNGHLPCDPDINFPPTDWQSIIYYHYADGSTSSGRNWVNGCSAPSKVHVNSPSPSPNATGYDIYLACKVWSGYSPSKGCVASTQPMPTPTLQQSNQPIGSDYYVPESGLVIGGLPPPDPNTVDYAAGTMQITFASPPAVGASITVDYIYNGWMSGGTGLMDEDGTHPWIGTVDYFCLVPGLYMCNGTILPQATANPVAAADLTGWVAQVEANYHKNEKAIIRKYNPTVPYFGIDQLGNNRGVARKEKLQGAAPYVDGILHFTIPSAETNKWDYLTQYLGDKPILVQMWYGATADSAINQAPGTANSLMGGLDYPNQEGRGAAYLNDATTLQAYKSPSTGSYPIVGLNYWALTDSAGEQIAWGPVSTNDNPYDGKSSCVRTGVDPWGYATGGESTVPSWQATTAYPTPNGASGRIQANVSGGLYTFEVITAGTSGGSPPAWPTAQGATVTDGTVIWENLGTRTNATCYGDEVDYLKQANSLWWTAAGSSVSPPRPHPSRNFHHISRIRRHGSGNNLPHRLLLRQLRRHPPGRLAG